MAMYSNQLVPPPKGVSNVTMFKPFRLVCLQVSSGLGEERSGKRGPVSIHLLPPMTDLGGLKDK